MTTKQQQIAIAEWMGWSAIEKGTVFLATLNGCVYSAATAVTKEAVVLMSCPLYPADLNAMHEAEKRLEDKQQVWYLQRLAQVRLRQGEGGMIACILDRLAFSTAHQRCEALCRTLWPERWNMAEAAA